MRIVDRKKEIIINAAGKNMSPANIEATLKGASPLIGQACVIGDGRPVQHGADRARRRLRARLGRAERARGRRPRGARRRASGCAPRCRRASTRPTRKLSRVEQIKRFTIVAGDWLPGGDELTPTMKLKRKPIGEKYARRDRGDVRR